MKTSLLVTIVAASLLAGCASVPMDSLEKDKLAKEFNLPSEGRSGLYIYRAGGAGTALKKRFG